MSHMSAKLRRTLSDDREGARNLAVVRLDSLLFGDIKSTQPNNAHSMIPKSFEMKAGGKKFWVNPNATEHMAEYATRHQGKSKKITESQKITEQQLLTSLHEATKEAVKRGYTYEEEIKVDHWSLVFSAPREAGKLPTIKHALYKP